MDAVINDFTLNIATANGTGSQSANLILLHSMFEMGVPVSGKICFRAIFRVFRHGILFEFQIRDIKHREIELTFRL